ncbi:MAG TPA: glycosyltransferase, partial [Burkholderiaceae bacterium]
EEATQPSIVTAGRVRGVHEAELISQLAVLLGAEEPHIDFTWLGAADPGSRVRLQAAGVQVLDLPGDASCAAHLASGWIFLAPGRVRGFPLFVAQAMAAGLPCVAFDCPAHRAVIRDGQTGFLCTSAQDMIDRIALLVDDLDLRERLGAAARQEARRRFSESEFGTKLLAAYSQPA